ncbi:MAG TPA: AsmA family protein [Burkholderiales bacterium]|jgi:AsmA protein|nr:AsmA family protein [Burkholderiales bacterium]
MRALKWIVGIFGVVFIACFLFLFFGLNTLRGPIARAVEKSTGRELVIRDIRPLWSWIHPRIRIDGITFANAPWAKEKYLLSADSAVVTLSGFPLVAGHVVLPEVHLVKAQVNLEQDADGRKNWILEREPKPQKASRIQVKKLTLDQGVLTYNDAGRDISVRADLSTDTSGVGFQVQGKHAGLPLAASGHGGPVLSLRDDDGTPYPLKAQAKIGDTAAAVDGNITGLIGLSGIDMNVQLSGKTMEQLYDILGVAFPHTSPYSTAGHLVRSGTKIRYENFTGKVGDSDLAGTLEVDTSGERPVMRGDLVSKVLDLADLGPVVGTQKTKGKGVLPDAPFDAKRWKSVDADVRLRAGKIERPEQLPIENLSTRIRMQDAVLTLDPLEFGVAGGRLIGPIRLDGRAGDSIRADAKIRVDKLQLSKLFPTLKVTKASVGAISGAVELAGQGNSVANMLGTANGKIGVYVNGGQVSELIMQAAAMDLWGVAKVYLKGDQQIPIRCVVGDWGVKNGVMQTNALVFDTQVVNVGGSGDINLKNEQLDLTFFPEPKDKSLASLNSPLYVRGTFGDPQVRPDTKKLVAKGAGALIMGILNPLLAVVPLVNEGPGKDSNCGKLIAEATSKTGAATATASSARSASSGASGPRRPEQSAR